MTKITAPFNRVSSICGIIFNPKTDAMVAQKEGIRKRVTIFLILIRV